MYYVLFLFLYFSDQNRLEQVKLVRDCGRRSQMLGDQTRNSLLVFAAHSAPVADKFGAYKISFGNIKQISGSNKNSSTSASNWEL